MSVISETYTSTLRRIIGAIRETPAGTHPVISLGFGITALIAISAASDDLYARLPSEECRSAWRHFTSAASAAFRGALMGGACILLAEECKVSLKEQRNGRAALAALSSSVAGILLAGDLGDRLPEVKRLLMKPLNFIIDHAEGLAGALLTTLGAIALAKAGPSMMLVTPKGDVALGALAAGGLLSVLAGSELMGRHLDVPILRRSLSGPIKAIWHMPAGQALLGTAMAVAGCATLANGAAQLLHVSAGNPSAATSSATPSSTAPVARVAHVIREAFFQDGGVAKIWVGSAAASFGISIACNKGESMNTAFLMSTGGACRLAFGAALASYARTSLLLNNEVLGIANVAAATGAAVLGISAVPMLALPLTSDLPGAWTTVAKLRTACLSAGGFALATVLGRHSMASLRCAADSSLSASSRLKEAFFSSFAAQGGLLALGASMHALVTAAQDTVVERIAGATLEACVNGLRFVMRGPQEHPWLTLATLSAVGYAAMHGAAGMKSMRA